MKSLLQTLAFAVALPGLLIGLMAIGVYSSGAHPQALPLSQSWWCWLIVALYFGAFVAQWAYERSRWNNGVCRDNGLAWQLAYVDSGNGRAYQAGDRRLCLNNIFIGG